MCGQVVMFADFKCFVVRSKFGTNIDTVASNRGWNRGTKVKGHVKRVSSWTNGIKDGSFYFSIFFVMTTYGGLVEYRGQIETEHSARL